MPWTCCISWVTSPAHTLSSASERGGCRLNCGSSSPQRGMPTTCSRTCIPAERATPRGADDDEIGARAKRVIVQPRVGGRRLHDEQLDPGALPVDPDAAVVARAGGRDVTDLVLNGGEDYQLLLAVPAERVDAARELALFWNVGLTDIGQFEAGEPAVSLRTAEGEEPLEAAAHDHFLASGRARAAGAPR